MSQQDCAGSVMVVDDDPLMLETAFLLLSSHGYAVSCFENGKEALAAFRAAPTDVILTDINMPVLNGFRLLEKIRDFDLETPVIFITGNAELDVALSAIRLQAFEFIVKPFSPAVLINTIERGINRKRFLLLERRCRAELEQAVVQRTSELADALRVQQQMNREIVERLTTAAELRNKDTGMHNSRLGTYANIIASKLGMPTGFIDNITFASSMHDIGKIGIPDSILLSPLPLTQEECEIIKTHTIIGDRILRGSDHPLLQLAASIAMNHHERWDGTGYPHGLRGEAIPLEGRIVMLVDQYDALRSRRSYKLPFDHQTACSIILAGDQKTRPEHFDPQVLAAFAACKESFAEIFALSDEAAMPTASSDASGADAAEMPTRRSTSELNGKN